MSDYKKINDDDDFIHDANGLPETFHAWMGYAPQPERVIIVDGDMRSKLEAAEARAAELDSRLTSMTDDAIAEGTRRYVAEAELARLHPLADGYAGAMRQGEEWRVRAEIAEAEWKHTLDEREEWKDRALASPCKCAIHELPKHNDLCEYGRVIHERDEANARAAELERQLKEFQGEMILHVDRLEDERDEARAQAGQLAAEISHIKERRFPIQDGPSIQWSVIKPWEKQAAKNHNQTLEQLSIRGGLGVLEAIDILSGKQYGTTNPHDDQNKTLLRIVKELQALTATPAEALAYLEALEKEHESGRALSDLLHPQRVADDYAKKFTAAEIDWRGKWASVEAAKGKNQ